MPFIVATKRSVPRKIGRRRAELETALTAAVSRRAVATLEEARERCTEAILDTHFEGMGDAFHAAQDQIARLPESGGSVGPLPDGTTITVEPTGVLRLYSEARYKGEWDEADTAKACAAYNAKQETTPMTTAIIQFKAGLEAPEDGGWPTEVQSPDADPIGLTWNREPLNQNEATYVDAAGRLYVLTRLRSGHIVGVIEAPAAEPDPKDGDERVESWGKADLKVTLRYSAKYEDWLAVGEVRECPFDGNAAVRFDGETEKPKGSHVPICDLLGGHAGWELWDEWSSWPILRAEDEEAEPTQGEST